MNSNELIARLDHLGARLVVKGDKLFCDAPKDAIGPELLTAIRANKADLIGMLDKVNGDHAGNNEPRFTSVSREKAHPLSFAQKRMMVLHAMQSDEGVFNTASAYAIKGMLEARQLQAALTILVARHELLRTRFVWVNDEPVQQIAEACRPSLKVIDLPRAVEADRDDPVSKVIALERKKPFDISRAPLLRAILIRTSNKACVLLLVSHYLVADDTSISIIAAELSRHYDAMASDRSVADGPTFQYVDFVYWERALLNSPSGKQQLDHWSDRLRQFNPDGPNTSGPAYPRRHFHEADSIGFDFSEAGTVSLATLAREHRASLFMVTYAIFSVVAAGLYNRHRFFCGTPIVNRARVELENMIGYFANTLLLNIQLVEDQTFADYLDSVRTDVLGAFANSDIPLEFALQKIGTTASELTRLMFTYTEDDPVILEFGQLATQRIQIEETGAQNAVFELSLFVRRTRDRLVFHLFYAKALLEPAVLDCLIRDFRKVAEAIVASPQVTIGDLMAGCESMRGLKESFLAPAATQHWEPSATAYKAPRSETERQLVQIWTDILQAEKVGVSDNFFLLGGDSFQAVRMFAALARQTGCKMPISSLFQAPTIEALTRMINDPASDRQWSPIVPIQPMGSRPPLFFIHGAGGNVLLYRDLSRRLGRGQPFYGIQARGLDGRSELLDSVEALAEYYVKEVRLIQSQGPYYLGGYCLGGQIAYEMARRLTEIGETVALVALLDTQRQWNTERRFDLRLTHVRQQIAFHLRNFLLADLKGKRAFVKEKAAELNRRGYRRLLVYLSTLSFWLKLRSERPLVLLEHVNDRAAEKYVPLPYSGVVTLFCPKRNYAGYDDPLMGWGNGLVQELDVQQLSMYPAGMLVEPFVAELAEKLQASLERARGKHNAAHDQ